MAVRSNVRDDAGCCPILLFESLCDYEYRVRVLAGPNSGQFHNLLRSNPPKPVTMLQLSFKHRRRAWQPSFLAKRSRRATPPSTYLRNMAALGRSKRPMTNLSYFRRNYPRYFKTASKTWKQLKESKTRSRMVSRGNVRSSLLRNDTEIVVGSLTPI